MDYASLPLFNLMKSKLSYHSARQNVLAQNIANADTPGYKAKDVQTPDFAKMLQKQQGLAARSLHSPSQLQMTQAGHIKSVAKTMPFVQSDRKETFELNPNGNNVSVEEEMAEVAKNQAEYVKTLNLYSKTISMFRTALGNPSGG